jgi:hypothetical protein
MGGSSSPDSAVSNDGGSSNATQAFGGSEQYTGPPVPGSASGSADEPAAEAADDAPSGLVRYGPGIPVTVKDAVEAGQTARNVWSGGPPPAPRRRRKRLRTIFGTAFTILLLAASGVVLFLRFHHAPFQVTGVAISQQTPTAGCGVDVTGRITTNGSAGTFSYQWVFPADRQPPQPLSQSVNVGQQAVFVTVAIQGSGHGSTSQTVILQVLGPSKRSSTAAVVIKC